MRPMAVILTGIFGIVALGATVWIGRYQGATTPLVSQSTSEKEEVLGPPISPKGPYPRAVADETEFNFGAMSPKAKGEHVFVIRNEGEADLELVARKEDTTCSCTFGELSRDGKIAPGESVEVTLNWEIKIPSGEYRHHAIVRTNDPEHQQIELAVAGRVEGALLVQPEGIWNLGQILPDQPAEVKGVVYSGQIDAFEIKEAKSQKELAEFSFEPMTPEQLSQYRAKSGYNVTAKIVKQTPVGSFSDPVTIVTDVEQGGEVGFSLTGSRAGPLEILGPGYHASANALLMGEFPAKDGKSVTLSIFVRDLDQDLELLDVKQLHDSCVIELTKDDKLTGNAQRYILKVTVKPGPPIDRQRKLSEKVDLFFNHPDLSEMRIYVDYLAI